MDSDFTEAVNIGSEEMVTIDQLARMVADIAGKRIHLHHVPGPIGVRGRNSDNRYIKENLGWAPSEQRFRAGLEKTYSWIDEQLSSHHWCYSIKFKPQRERIWSCPNACVKDSVEWVLAYVETDLRLGHGETQCRLYVSAMLALGWKVILVALMPKRRCVGLPMKCLNMPRISTSFPFP